MLPLVIFGGLLMALAEGETEPVAPTPPPRRNRPPRYGSIPTPGATPSASSTLRSAALAPAGSWTRRNTLQAGAAASMQRRLSGTASEADFAVLRAARPGIASSRSGPISGAWSGAPWSADGGAAMDTDSIADKVVAQMFA